MVTVSLAAAVSLGILTVTVWSPDATFSRPVGITALVPRGRPSPSSPLRARRRCSCPGAERSSGRTTSGEEELVRHGGYAYFRVITLITLHDRAHLSPIRIGSPTDQTG